MPNRPGNVTNPTGKGGFGDNPQNINISGSWSSADSISYQYKKLIKLTVEEFDKWKREHPKKERTVAQDIAYKAVMEAKKDLPYLKELTDRTEGKVPQGLDMTSGGKPLPLLDFTKKRK